MNGEMKTILAKQDVKEKLLSQGGVAVASTPEGMAARIKADLAKWGKVVRTANVRIE
jgi:tripartite-type tricarboxylate transporter receptor subunit TctC